MGVQLEFDELYGSLRQYLMSGSINSFVFTGDSFNDSGGGDNTYSPPIWGGDGAIPTLTGPQFTFLSRKSFPLGYTNAVGRGIALVHNIAGRNEDHTIHNANGDATSPHPVSSNNPEMRPLPNARVEVYGNRNKVMVMKKYHITSSTTLPLELSLGSPRVCLVLAGQTQRSSRHS